MGGSRGLAFVALILVAFGCASPSSELPGAPSPPTTTSPVLVTAGDRWNLKSVYLGHTGPAACIAPFDGERRTYADYVLRIQRDGAAIHLVTEHNHYIGTVEGDQFRAHDNEDVGSTWPCSTARLRFRTEGQVSGRLSADGHTLTGEEVAVFVLESGEMIRRQWHWSATRQSE